MRLIKFVIQYDGTNYHGWQRQAIIPTIQQVIEETLKKITNEDIKIKGSGRTDSGVHALAQVAHCKIATSLDDLTLLRATNAHLPKDILIKELSTETDSFDAQKNVYSKTYFYQILNTPFPDPMLRHYSWWLPKALDQKVMNEIASKVVGGHDFSAFRNRGGSVKTTVRNIYSSHFYEHPPYLVYEIEGGGFLKQMVRNLVSTFVRTGYHQMTATAFEELFASMDRRRCPPPAPARGLFLKKVTYL